MRQLLPEPVDEVDVFDAYRPPQPRWLRLDMVVAVDGAATDERGRTAHLGGEGDREVFRTLRAHADAIVVGAGTARAEGYGPHRVRADLARRRAETGLAPAAAVAVVTSTLSLDLTAPLFTEARARTVVVTCAAAPPERRRAAAAVAEVVEAGDREVDLATALDALRGRGYERLLCEGGPRLNAGLLEAGLVDELCVTIAPVLLPQVRTRLAAEVPGRFDLGLTTLLEHRGELHARYRLGR